VRDVVAPVERQLHAAPQIDEDHGATFELLSDDPVRRKAETITVETQGAFEVVNTQRENGNVILHY
jgi:hypothetical protein